MANPYSAHKIDYTRFRPDRKAEAGAKNRKAFFDFLGQAAPIAGTALGGLAGGLFGTFGGPVGTALGASAGAGLGMKLGGAAGDAVGSMATAQGDAQMDETRRKAYEREAILAALSNMRGF